MNFIRLCKKNMKKKSRNLKNMNKLFWIQLRMDLYQMIIFNRKFNKLYNG